MDSTNQDTIEQEEPESLQPNINSKNEIDSSDVVTRGVSEPESKVVLRIVSETNSNAEPSSATDQSITQSLRERLVVYYYSKVQFL